MTKRFFQTQWRWTDPEKRERDSKRSQIKFWISKGENSGKFLKEHLYWRCPSESQIRFALCSWGSQVGGNHLGKSGGKTRREMCLRPAYTQRKADLLRELSGVPVRYGHSLFNGGWNLRGHISARTLAWTSNPDSLNIIALRLEEIMQSEEEEYCFSNTLVREVNVITLRLLSRFSHRSGQAWLKLSRCFFPHQWIKTQKTHDNTVLCFCEGCLKNK